MRLVKGNKSVKSKVQFPHPKRRSFCVFYYFIEIHVLFDWVLHTFLCNCYVLKVWKLTEEIQSHFVCWPFFLLQLVAPLQNLRGNVTEVKDKEREWEPCKAIVW